MWKTANQFPMISAAAQKRERDREIREKSEQRGGGGGGGVKGPVTVWDSVD